MKNILLLIKGLGRGGAEQLLVSSIRYGDRTRYRYEVAFLLPWKDAFIPSLEALGVNVRCLDGAHGAGWVMRLRTLVREHDIDLVHVHSPYPASAVRVALPRSKPIVYTEHNLWKRYHPATYWANLLTYPRNNHVFAVSRHVQESIAYPKPFSLLPRPPIETLYHGPDPAAVAAAVRALNAGAREEFGIPEDVPVVGTVANLKAHKGHEQLLEAAVRIRRSIPDARFVLVGQGPLEGQLRDRAHGLGLDGAVTFAGYREDALRIAKTFDVFVLPSVHEGLAIALIEAMALGKPTVVTRVGGLPEVVRNGQEGFVVPPAKPAELAAAIVTLLQEPGLRRSFGAAAQRRAEAFSIEGAVNRIESVYEELTR